MISVGPERFQPRRSVIVTRDQRAEALEVKRRFWRQHIQRWKRSGLKQSVYCWRQELKLHCFTYWRKKVRPKAPAPVSLCRKKELALCRQPRRRPCCRRVLQPDRDRKSQRLEGPRLSHPPVRKLALRQNRRRLPQPAPQPPSSVDAGRNI